MHVSFKKKMKRFYILLIVNHLETPLFPRGMLCNVLGFVFATFIAHKQLTGMLQKLLVLHTTVAFSLQDSMKPSKLGWTRLEIHLAICFASHNSQNMTLGHSQTGHESILL